jgi:hypothetical protein
MPELTTECETGHAALRVPHAFCILPEAARASPVDIIVLRDWQET